MVLTEKMERTALGLALALPYLLLTFSVEIINYLGALRTEFSSVAEHATFLLTWPLAQGQHLLVALVLFFLGRFCTKLPGKVVASLALIALHGITVLDQLAYKLFHNHTPLEATELNIKTLGR